MGRRLLTVAIGLLLAVSVSAEKVDLGNNVDGVNVIVEQSNAERTIVRIDIGAFDMEAIDIEGNTYHLLKVTKEGS
ncbi:MAG: hypothetical protein KAW46_04705, partial [candidate division Zixibacteria bacterium]|nr:hypothetical protein [candidate division Zixibacteria bacterium]